jgi:hypothetical protein
MTAAERPYLRFPRPTSPYYEVRSEYLSQGDLLEEVPFGVIGPELLYLQDLPGAILHQVEFHRGMIVSPTCDFRRPTIEHLRNDPSQPPYTLQPHVVVAQVLPIEVIAERWGANRATNMRLMLEFDAPRRYMYLPPLPGDDRGQQWVVDFTRTDSIAIELLVDQRTYQLTHAAAQHLQYKLVLAGTSVYTDRGVFDPPMT